MTRNSERSRRRRRAGEGRDKVETLRRGLRQEIAWLAARLIAEDGAVDFDQAKRKAARQLGVDIELNLPNDVEVEQHLRIHLTLFQDGGHADRLQCLREIAVDAMERLAAFTPRLRGPVLEGTSGAYARVEIDLYTDNAKDVELFLINAGVSYQVAPLRQLAGRHNRNQLALEITHRETQLTINVRPGNELRLVEKRSADGSTLRKATIEEVRALLEGTKVEA